MQTCHSEYSELPRECYGCVNWHGGCIHGIDGEKLAYKFFMRVEEPDGTLALFGEDSP